jgi:hypothetical protein
MAGCTGLADGFRRVNAYLEAEHTHVACEVRQGSQRDAILFSVSANASHGLRRTNADKRRAVELLILDPEWARWSSREIAKAAAVDDKFVGKIRGKLSATADGPQLAARKGADGKVRKAPKRKKGAKHFDASAIAKLACKTLDKPATMARCRAHCAIAGGCPGLDDAEQRNGGEGGGVMATGDTKKPGGRNATGTVVTLPDGRLQGIITMHGERKRLPPFPKGMSRAMSEDKTAAKAEQAAKMPAPKVAPVAANPGTFEPWFTAWCADRESRGYTTIADSVGHYTKHIQPSIGDKSIKDWTTPDMRKLCRDLDAKVQSGAIAWKTAFNIWGTATRMCDDACQSKSEELRVRDDNPSTGVRGPDRGANKLKQFLYPSEVAAFVAAGAVPLLWRRLLAVAVYSYLRDAEIRALT